MKITIKLLLVILALFGLIETGITQKQTRIEKRLIKKYSTFLEEDSKLIYINYYQSFERIQDRYVLKTFNPDKMVMTIYNSYKDEEMEIKDGEYKEWLDSGSIWKDGEFKDGEKSGLWKYYEGSGSLQEYGEYKDGEEQGRWFTLDTLGRKKSEYSFIKGELSGEYINYDTLGNVTRIRKYIDDEIISDKVLDSINYIEPLRELDEMPILKKCKDLPLEAREKCVNTEFMNYIYKNITYPKNARQIGVEGKAIIRFYIDKEGNVKEAVALRGVCNEIENECLRIINSSPKWSPGIENGEPVRVYFSIPIKFKLE